MMRSINLSESESESGAGNDGVFAPAISRKIKMEASISVVCRLLAVISWKRHITWYFTHESSPATRKQAAVAQCNVTGTF